MEPRHGTNTPSTQLSPYVVLVSKSSYSPGDSISVMLRGLCGTQFLGFLAQTRRADPADQRYRANPSQAIGTFQAVAGTQYHCGQGGVALTHDGRYGGTTLLFNWTAPSQPEGHVQIKATFVANFSSTWTSVASVVIQDPQASPLSVDADTLRTDFITPCEPDRPRPKTTPSPDNPTTPVIPTDPPTTTTTTTTTAPISSTSASSVTTEVAVTSPAPEMSTQASLTEENVTAGVTTEPNDDLVCTSTQICEFRVAWQPRNESVWFDVMVPPLDNLEEQWLALAFSDDPKMGQDSVVECLTERDAVTSHLSFNGDHENSILSSDEAGGMMSGVRVSREDGYLHCQFVRQVNMSQGDSRVYDLHHDWFLLLAQGSVRQGDLTLHCFHFQGHLTLHCFHFQGHLTLHCFHFQGHLTLHCFHFQGRKERHAGIPVASARLVDLQSLDDVGVWVQDKVFIKVHASLMSIAWIFCAGFGIIMARYSKPLWPKHKLCGRKVWFTVHRGCMVMLAVLTLLGFIIIFVEAGGMSEVSAKEFQKLHPVVGIVVTIFTAAQVTHPIIFNPFTAAQIVFGIFRPSSSSKNRPVYNWGHWLLGFTCHVMSIFNMGLGLNLRKSGTHSSASFVLYAYAIYEICMFIALEIICCNIRIKENKTASYVIYERRNTIYSSTKEIMQGNANEPPGSIALRIAIRVHLLFVTAFTAALIALIAIAH
ncbi:putative ferric-chelate reductase 1 [Babylonia areolata]|uniref:putative ferric-chelate reductase 1 n=1 Tax=Babylonia areolata TaxID=304850 RepID=UPI003FD5203E